MEARINKKSAAPARTLDKDYSIKHREPCHTLDEQYKNLDQAVRDAGLGNPITVNEGEHTPVFEQIIKD